MPRKTAKQLQQDIEELREKLRLSTATSKTTIEGRLAALENRIQELDSRFDDIEVSVSV